MSQSASQNTKKTPVDILQELERSSWCQKIGDSGSKATKNPSRRAMQTHIRRTEATMLRSFGSNTASCNLRVPLCRLSFQPHPVASAPTPSTSSHASRPRLAGLAALDTRSTTRSRSVVFKQRAGTVHHQRRRVATAAVIEDIPWTLDQIAGLAFGVSRHHECIGQDRPSRLHHPHALLPQSVVAFYPAWRIQCDCPMLPRAPHYFCQTEIISVVYRWF